MIFSHHAHQRWAERCAGLDMKSELAGAKAPGKRLRLLLEGPAPVVPRKGYRYAKYLIGPSGVVFVMTTDLAMVVTVFHVAECKRRARRRKAEKRRIKETRGTE